MHLPLLLKPCNFFKNLRFGFIYFNFEMLLYHPYINHLFICINVVFLTFRHSFKALLVFIKRKIYFFEKRM